jgi:hypothetical protein
MSEWLKEHAWKACVGETLPRVRIPLSPPTFAKALAALAASVGRPRQQAFAKGAHHSAVARRWAVRRLGPELRVASQLTFRSPACIFARGSGRETDARVPGVSPQARERNRDLVRQDRACEPTGQVRTEVAAPDRRHQIIDRLKMLSAYFCERRQCAGRRITQL